MSGKTFDTDILKPLPVEKWPLLQSKIKYNWPLYAYYYYWIENAITWKKRNANIPIQLYCPNGDYESGTFVAISQFSLYIVIVFTLEPTGKTLKTALIETKYINWNESTYFAAVHAAIIPTVLSAIECLKDTHHLEIYPMHPAQYHFKSAEECVNVDINIPEECYLKVLDKSDIPLIHSVWPHKDPKRPDLSVKYLTTMVEMNNGIGLYLKEGNSLVSWAIHTDWNGMGMVQTLEEHKRKGYAKIVINALAKYLGEMGISTTLFIIDGNVPSQKLYRGLGWKSISPVSWIILKGNYERSIT